MEEKSGHFGRISPRKRNAARELADPHAILHFTRLGPQYQSLRPQITIAHGFTVGCRSGQVGLYSGIGGGLLQVPVSAPSCSVQGGTEAVRLEIRPGYRMAAQLQGTDRLGSTSPASPAGLARRHLALAGAWVR